VLACSGLDVLGLTAGGLVGGELVEGGLDVLGLVAGGLDGPRVAPGGLDGFGRGVGLGLDGPGRGVGLAQASELPPIMTTATRPGAARRAAPRLGLDGLSLGLAGDALAGLGLTAGDEPAGLGLAGVGLVELGLPLGGALAEPGLLAGLAAGVASAGVDDAQLAAGCP